MLLKNKQHLIDLTKEFLTEKLKLNYVFCGSSIYIHTPYKNSIK